MKFTLGIDSFAFHRYYGEFTRWETPLDFRWTPDDFIAYGHRHGVNALSLQTCYLPPLTDSYLDELRAQLKNLSRVLTWGHPDGLQGGKAHQAAENLMTTLPKAKALGCSLVRFVAGNHFYYHLDPQERIRALVPMIREIAQEAANHGLDLAMENHADFQIRHILTIIDQVGAPNLGICFDSGNAIRVGDDPVEAARLAAPLVKMVHLKDLRVQEASKGDPTALWPSAPVGQGDFDIPLILETLDHGGYHGCLFVELAGLHSDWHNEEAVVAESLQYLRDLLNTP